MASYSLADQRIWYPLFTSQSLTPKETFTAMLRRVAAKRDALALVWVCRGLMRPLGRRESQRRGDVAQNVALGVSIGMDRRTKRKLKAGIDIPTPKRSQAAD